MASSSSAQATPATTVTDDPDIDAEKIQSTVDVSLSLALSLVQTWMPSASSAPLDQSVVQSRKKLEEYMRRPPRLGVGTPIPTAQHTQATYHETQKLKNRLVGSGAARRKAEEETKVNGTGSKRPGSHRDEEDDSESRANVMRKKQARTGINGLSVFGGGKGGKGSKPNSNTEAQPQPQANAAVTSTPVRERTPPAPTSPTCSFSSTAKASPEPSASTEADAGTRSSPHAEPPAIQATPDEPMGIHKLPAKLPLASKIWPQSPSPPQSKRRKTLTAMLPPQSPSHTWNLALPRHSLSRSASESVASSSVPSSSATDPGLDSTARLSRKERKRLRKAAQQTETQIQENAAKDLEGRPADPGRDSVSESKSRDACTSPPDLGVVAMTATSTPRPRPTEADLDDSDGDDDESEEMVSRTSEEHRVVAQDDTMQDGGKKKRKRRARKKPGTG